MALGLQRSVGFLALPLLYCGTVAWMRFWMRYRIEGLAETRKAYREMTARRGPLLICANHLTLIDSLLIAWALGSLGDHWTRFRAFPWNVPERKNFFKGVFLRAFCWAGKCVPVSRLGTADEKHKALSRIKHLLGLGETVLIFPEGGRSRTGRVDTLHYAYGAGQILEDLRASGPHVKVLCVYLRGRTQESFSDFPARRDRFSVRLKLIEPGSEHRGLRAARDRATAVIRAIAEIEREYFCESPA